MIADGAQAFDMHRNKLVTYVYFVTYWIAMTAPGQGRGEWSGASSRTKAPHECNKWVR